MSVTRFGSLFQSRAHDAEDDPLFLPVFSSGLAVGGVEAVADHVHQALVAAGYPSAVYAGGRQIAASRRPHDAWFAMTWKAHALALARHPRPRRGGFVWTHGAELTRDRGWLMQCCRRFSLHASERLLAVSPLSLDLLPGELQPRVALIGPPIVVPKHPRRTAPASISGTEGPLHLLSIGRAIPRKGHDKAIAVARELARRIPVVLRIVGPGPDLTRLSGLATAGTVGFDVQFLGNVKEDVKARLYDSSDALLFLARNEGTEYEGLGLVVLEAAAHGCPSVVLDCGGSRYTTVNGQSGLFLRQGAPVDEIADAAYEVATQPAFRSAARRFAEHFDLARWRQRLHTVLQGENLAWEWPSRRLI
jgi:glycosyltransferase involved in cell wall biosynthesis